MNNDSSHSTCTVSNDTEPFQSVQKGNEEEKKNNMEEIDFKGEICNTDESLEKESECIVKQNQSHFQNNSCIDENSTVVNLEINSVSRGSTPRTDSPNLSVQSSEVSHDVKDVWFDFDSLLSKSPDVLVEIIKENFQKRLCIEEENKRYQNELDRYKTDSSPEIYQSHIETLEKDLAQAKANAFAWENELKIAKEKFSQEISAIKADFSSKLEYSLKKYEAANREKESMVVKYAMAEKEVLIVKKQKEGLEKKVKDLERDKEILQNKIKTLTAERSRICNTLDNKIQETGIANRHIDKLKEELNAKDIKIKWGQAKLKAEIDAHKETQARLDTALSRICNHEEEVQSTREEAEKLVKETKDGENTRANILDKQLRETKALLIMEKQKFEDINSLYQQLKSEHEVLRSSHILIDTEVNTLRVKVAKHEQDREESEKLFESLQNELKNLKQGTADLSQKLSYSEVYVEQLQNERSKSEIAEQKVKDLQAKLDEQSYELAQCRAKEAELLAFTQKLTDKDVTLQSQLTASQGKVRLLELEHGEMQSQVRNLEGEVLKLRKELHKLREEKKIEENRLSALLLERTKEAESLRTKMSDLTNEIQVQQKKYSNSLKDSNREIQKLRKKLDALENSSPNVVSTPNISDGFEGDLRNGEPHPSWSKQEPLSQESRASSDISLNTGDSSHTNGSTPNCIIRDPTTMSPISDLPQQVLIDRIIKLQKTIIKKTEKCEFLEEHVSQLVSELKKKNKIIHHYILKEDTGVLANSKSDDAKAEIIKHGGIMASVYGSTPRDGTMTLELSLEINRKLQAVLEDTLLKNITLKENLNTLGDEVAKLALNSSSSKLSS